jgi:hypothetical protein
VEVAIVRINIPQPKFESSIWERMKKSVEEYAMPDAELNALVSGNYIDQAIQLYNVETRATLELMKEYRALEPYIKTDIDPNAKYSSCILSLTVGNDSSYRGLDLGKYMRMVRLKYWRALFSNEEFMARLTSKLREDFLSQVEEMGNYDFSAFNIKQVMVEMNASISKGVEDAIVSLFDKLTAEHAWYPECQQNKHYFTGWKTNKAHKIGKKSIIPVNGVFAGYSWEKKTFNTGNAYNVISDIEKALDYLDGGRTEHCDLMARLKVAEQEGITRNIECKYFKVDFFKKGTMHIKFLPDAMPLVERLNIYAAQKKNWLPPNYGKTSYGNMDVSEREVVDSFHGDGSEGSGAKKYQEVLTQSAYYLANPTQRMPALTAPAT